MNKSSPTKNLPNYYRSLDIIPGSSHNEIVHAYTRAKMTYSKDSLASYSLIDDSTKQNMLEEIEGAFSTLGNPARRREYDMHMGFATWSEESSIRSEDSAFTDMPYKHRAEPMPTPRGSSVRDFVDRDEETPKATLHVLETHRSKNSAPADLPADFQPNPEFEGQVKTATDVDGAFLKAVRIYRKLTTEQLANRCRLSAQVIVTIEEEDQGHFYAPVYLRGHVRIIAAALGFPDPDTISKNYIIRMNALGKLTKNVF